MRPSMPSPFGSRDRASRRAVLVVGILFAAALLAAGCATPQTYDRGRSLKASVDVIVGDPGQDIEDLGADVSSFFARAARDARELPKAVADFAAFFY